MNILSLIRTSPVVKWCVMPLMLFCFSGILLLTHTLGADFSPTVVSYYHPAPQDTPQLQITLTEKGVLKGTFVAQENYLGIVSLEFVQTDIPIASTVVFRIRELGASEWMSENTYNSQDFYYVTQYPFGFPIIQDSKNKTYEFEMKVIKHGQTVRFVLDATDPSLVSKYKFPVAYLLGDTAHLLHFMYIKMAYAVYALSIYTLSAYFIPVVAYYVLIFLVSTGIFQTIFWNAVADTYVGESLKRSVQVLLKPAGVVFAGALLATVYTAQYGVFSVLVLLLLAYVLWKHKPGLGFVYVLAMSMVALGVFFSSMELAEVATRSITWAYYFLVIGVLGMVYTQWKK